MTTDTTDPIAAAIDHIRSITTVDNPWTADDVSSFSPWEPDESDYAIATILNAVVSGQLISRHSRDEMLAQVRRGEGFATAGAAARWIADTEAGVYDADSAHGESKTGYWVRRKVAQDEIARLTAERDQALAQVALDRMLAEARQAESQRLREALRRAYDHVLRDAPDWFMRHSHEQQALEVERSEALSALRSSDDAGDRWVADNLASAMGMSDREIERSAAPRPALILWLLAMVMLALPGWIWLGVSLFGRWAGP